MLYRLLLMFRSRAFEPVVIVLGALATMAVLATNDHRLWTELAFVPCLLLLWALSTFPGVVATLAARDTEATLLIVVVYALVGGILSAMGQVAHGKMDSGMALRINAFYFLAGAIVGVILRYSLGRLVRLALIGKERVGQNCLVLVIWAIVLLLFPWNGHLFAATWYIFGVSSGVFLDKGIRLRVSIRAAAYRRLQEIADAWPAGVDAKPEELRALKLLAQGPQFPSMRFKTLSKYLEQVRGDTMFTPRLALVSASLKRLEGDYRGAVEETEHVVEPPQDLVDTHLTLLRALSLEELRDDKAVDRLLQILASSEHGRSCPLGTAVRARRRAEQALRSRDVAAVAKPPLAMALKALERRRNVMLLRMHARGKRQSLDGFLRSFLEVGVPVTPSLMLDIVGYTFVAAGFVEEGRVLLQRCLDLDPDFSYAYLHLGDYFYFRRLLASGDSRLQADDEWHARSCYLAAKLVERNPGSRVRHLASERLQDMLSSMA